MTDAPCGCDRGHRPSRRYVVRCATERKDRPPLITWWYGPDHGFGTTSGSSALVDGRAAEFVSRLTAENALRRVYGTLAEARRHGYEVVARPQTVT